MHTLLVIGGGLALLFSIVLVGRSLGSVNFAVGGFMVTWFVLSCMNAWVGVVRHGYEWSTELPILLVVFAIPATAAMLAARMMRPNEPVAERLET